MNATRRSSGNEIAGATEAIRLLATRQHGVVSRRQLVALGLSSGLIKARVANGRLLPLFTGVYALGTGHLDREGRWRAATLAAGATSVLSHRSAAALHGLIVPGRHAIEVIHPGPRRKKLVSVERSGTSTFSVLMRCTRKLPEHDMDEVSGIPVTSPARTLVDLAGLVGYKRLQGALLEAERLRVVSLPELDEVISRGRGWSGVRNLRRAVEEMSPEEVETRSSLEAELLRLCAEHDIEQPAVNVPIGPFVVDFFWEASRLVAETDTFRFHGSKPSFKSDRNRDVDLTLAGFRVVRFTDQDVVDNPVRTARKLKGLLGTGAR